MRFEGSLIGAVKTYFDVK